MSKIARAYKIIRVACYIRVSHDEQVKHGFSIATQKEHLQSFINQHDNYQLVDFYIDEGVSADKLKKRLELQRLLQDVKDGKIDLIIFTKLDRWFRSVPKYYQIQAILDENNVTWMATQEDYETVTANGKFKVNIMLSVAQQERDRTGERIIDVFNYKIQNKQAITGAMPLGYKIATIDGVKKIVFDDDKKDMVIDMLNYYMVNQNKNQTIRYIQDKYNYDFQFASLTKLLKNTMLYGAYRGIDGYCPAYLTKQQFDDLQTILKNNIKQSNNDRAYMFSKLIVCPICGYRLCGGVSTYKNINNVKVIKNRYRCENTYRVNNTKQCTFKKSKYEEYIESQLLQRLDALMKDYVLKYDIEDNKKPIVNESKIKREMERLTDVYIMGRLSKDDYEKRYNDLQAKLSYKPITRDLSNVKKLLKANILDLYNTLKQEEKRAFWHGLIKAIYIDDNFKITSVDFF